MPGTNGEDNGATDVGKLLPGPIGALIETVVGSAEGTGAVLSMVALNHEHNQRS